MPKYSDKTAKELDNYLKNYKTVFGGQEPVLSLLLKTCFVTIKQ